MMYYRISKNEKILFFGKKNRPGVGSDLNICFIHNLAEVDHSKFVSSRCYAPRAMFSCWLVNKRIPPREDSQS